MLIDSTKKYKYYDWILIKSTSFYYWSYIKNENKSSILSKDNVISEQDTQMISTWLSWDEPSPQEVLKLIQANRNLGSWTFTITYLRYRGQGPTERKALLCDHLSKCNKTCKPSHPSFCPYCAILCHISLYMQNPIVHDSSLFQHYMYNMNYESSNYENNCT